MDAIAGLLDGPRARGAFLLKLAFAPPWALRIQDEAPIAVISVVRGSALIYGDGEAPIRIGAGATEARDAALDETRVLLAQGLVG